MGIQKEFMQRYGERGYTAPQIGRALSRLRLSHYDTKMIRDYAKAHGLAVDLKAEGMWHTGMNTRSLIRDSHLIKLIKGMGGIAVSEEQLRSEILKEVERYKDLERVNQKEEDKTFNPIEDFSEGRDLPQSDGLEHIAFPDDIED